MSTPTARNDNANKLAAPSTHIEKFKAELRANIRAKISEMKRDGICAMGLDNLMQVVRTPSQAGMAYGGPNARWWYRQTFAECLKDTKLVRFTVLI